MVLHGILWLLGSVDIEQFLDVVFPYFPSFLTPALAPGEPWWEQHVFLATGVGTGVGKRFKQSQRGGRTFLVGLLGTDDAIYGTHFSLESSTGTSSVSLIPKPEISPTYWRQGFVMHSGGYRESLQNGTRWWQGRHPVVSLCLAVLFVCEWRGLFFLLCLYSVH